MKAYVAKASGAYFAAQPITDAIKAQKERDEALKWIDNTRELLVKIANYIADHEAVSPTRTAKALLKEIEQHG